MKTKQNTKITASSPITSRQTVEEKMVVVEKEMATHYSVLAWKIPWTEEPTVNGIAKSRTRDRKESMRVGLRKIIY